MYAISLDGYDVCIYGGSRSCRVLTSEAGGRSTRHTSPGVPVRRAATSGDRGALGGEVSCLSVVQRTPTRDMHVCATVLAHS